ncbi:MAG: phytanoyl-CoA dioxygenase family protein [bacterium]|nr:phytanoyl-CoA dioxygenase family protein [bacterium]
MFSQPLKDRYEENGFLVVEALFTDGELAPVRQRIDALIADPASRLAGVGIGREGDTKPETKGTGDVRGASFLVRFDPFFQDFARTPKLLDHARGLLGPRIKVFRDQALFKPPRGQAKPLHQDQSYFLVDPVDDLVTAWIALDEATLDNGCMTYVPGSHKHGIFPISPDPERPVHHIPDTGAIKLGDAVACPVPAGSVIFHHGCALHASADNHTDTWRKALILHFATSEAMSARDELNEQVSLEID